MTFTRNEQFHGRLRSADASAGVAIPLFDNDLVSRTLTSEEGLEINELMINAASGVDTRIDSIDQDTDVIAAADATAETFVIAGDVTAKYPVGSEFYVIGSTGNDGLYVVTDVSYSDPNTTITVADVAGDEDDGVIARVRTNLIRGTITHITNRGPIPTLANISLMLWTASGVVVNTLLTGTVIKR